jgi:hypothetical protein
METSTQQAATTAARATAAAALALVQQLEPNPKSTKKQKAQEATKKRNTKGLRQGNRFNQKEYGYITADATRQNFVNETKKALLRKASYMWSRSKTSTLMIFLNPNGELSISGLGIFEAALLYPDTLARLEDLSYEMCSQIRHPPSYGEHEPLDKLREMWRAHVNHTLFCVPTRSSGHFSDPSKCPATLNPDLWKLPKKLKREQLLACLDWAFKNSKPALEPEITLATTATVERKRREREEETNPYLMGGLTTDVTLGVPATGYATPALVAAQMAVVAAHQASNMEHEALQHMAVFSGETQPPEGFGSFALPALRQHGQMLPPQYFHLPLNSGPPPCATQLQTRHVPAQFHTQASVLTQTLQTLQKSESGMDSQEPTEELRQRAPKRPAELIDSETTKRQKELR